MALRRAVFHHRFTRRRRCTRAFRCCPPSKTTSHWPSTLVRPRGVKHALARRHLCAPVVRAVARVTNGQPRADLVGRRHSRRPSGQCDTTVVRLVGIPARNKPCGSRPHCRVCPACTSSARWARSHARVRGRGGRLRGLLPTHTTLLKNPAGRQRDVPGDGHNAARQMR